MTMSCLKTTSSPMIVTLMTMMVQSELVVILFLILLSLTLTTLLWLMEMTPNILDCLTS